MGKLVGPAQEEEESDALRFRGQSRTPYRSQGGREGLVEVRAEGGRKVELSFFSTKKTKIEEYSKGKRNRDPRWCCSQFHIKKGGEGETLINQENRRGNATDFFSKTNHKESPGRGMGLLSSGKRRYSFSPYDRGEG